MITITVNNSYSQVIGLTVEQLKGLRQVLSYSLDPQAAYFANKMWNNRVHLIDKKGNFPTGLYNKAWSYLAGLRPQTQIITRDNRVKPINQVSITLKRPVPKPYPEQQEAVVKALTSNFGTISACTGLGKSLIALYIVQTFKLKTLIVVPNLQLKQQLIELFTHYFKDLTNITIENIDSSKLQKANNYDMLIVDEAHHSAAATYRKLNRKYWNNIYHRFFLTATPFRSNPEEKILLESIAGELIYEIPYKLAVSKGYVVPVEAYYIEVPRSNPKGYTWAEVYSELVVSHKHRNKLITTFLANLTKSKASTLCIVKEIKHGHALVDLFADLFADVPTPPFIKGENEDNNEVITRFNSKASSCLVGTSGVIGEGVDTKPCEFVIIAGLGKAKGQFMQQVGRCVRTYPGKTSGKVIIFKDLSHKFTRNHFNEQIKILKDEYGVIPKKLDIL